MPSFIVLLGPPGAGKGTQAESLSARLHLPHISSGDIFRENLKNKTELGKLASGFINKGELVPDDITIAMIRERLSHPDCQEGALLDGFPRTPAQAEALSSMLSSNHGQVKSVPYICVPENVLIDRLAGRWTCREAGHIFHEKYNPPHAPGRCDFDGSELYQRPDDQAETVKNRIRVYLEQTQPLIEYYHQLGVLFEVDGTKSIEQVTMELLAAIQRNGYE
ncbi:MAG: adenylate kinase [Chloroflexi bacterium RBG_19FT_COMBO_50_10]|nr:MAG: adenylate kinase [Chloroflexi bacterium RBG_16_47_49]OGO62345.1 MAG: adenylate kinase [Chloroflexi bacterium RBG_19FT_COMBO_50_10]